MLPAIEFVKETQKKPRFGGKVGWTHFNYHSYYFLFFSIFLKGFLFDTYE